MRQTKLILFFTLILILTLFCNFIFAQEKWYINNPNGFDFYIKTTIKDGKIEGMSRKNALKDIVGGFKFILAKIGTSMKYPEIVHFVGDIENDSIIGKYQFLFNQRNFIGKTDNDSIHIILESKSGKITHLKGIKIHQIIPKRNYTNTFNEIFKLTEENIYNQDFIKSKDWRKFKKKMIKISSKTNDDFELQIAFYAISRDFPFSHYGLYQKNPEKSTGKSTKNFAELEEINERTCVLKIMGFNGSKQQMDSLISIIDHEKYQNLIIDLRNNPGGNHISAFPLVAFLIDKPIVAGVFPNKNWYRKFNRLPNKDDYDKFSEFAGGTMNEWFDRASQDYGSYFKIFPSEKHFIGKVYILTNKRTGSTCEPIVYGLKHHKYATIIGEHTAGAMLSSNEFIIDNNLTLRIPLNDYITYSGERIDKVGIEPDIEIESEKALEYTLNKIAVGN